ncbi:MAG TPA: efflux RND transporter permease subunit [Flavobacteriales bacterium]|nr:efflux RND transporter permease subunit [Flavobacteriales bacterium]HRJ37627.1 efflux RND transporter permease subunit [Flavobacteriales bacterium]
MSTPKKDSDKRLLLKDFFLTNWAISNVKTVLLITFMIVFAGISTYKSMPKEAFPELNIPTIYIGVPYPGAGPKVIEDKITRKIEKEVNTIRGVDKIKSTSIFGYSTIIVEFNFDVTPEQGLRKVKDAVDKARGDKDFPRDLPAEPNVFEMNFSEFPIMNINLSGNYSVDELTEFGEFLEDEIEKIEEISKVEIRGVQKKQVSISINKFEAESRMVSFGDIENAITSENMTMSGGEVKMSGIARDVRVEGEFASLEEIRNIIVKRDYYNIVRLRDVAEVTFGDEDTTSFARQNMKPVVMLDVIKRSGTNLLEASDKIFDVVNEAKAKGRIPSDLELTYTNDMSFKTRDQVSSLENNIISGVILVVLILQLFLGLRSALFVGVAIPMSMFLSFIILNVMGVTLNIMVLFSLVLALGMLVDNGIVVIENVYRLTNEGYSLFDAVKYGVGEIALPIISSTATTVAAFIPLALWPGLMGEFMQYLPLTLMIVLSSSLFVALVINPALAILLMKTVEERPALAKVIRNAMIGFGLGLLLLLLGKFTLGNLALTFGALVLINYYFLDAATNFMQNKLLPTLERRYRAFLEYALVKRPLTIFLSTIAMLFLSFMLVGVFQPKVLFFPENEPAYVNVFVELPVGTDIRLTNEITKSAELIIDSTLAKYDDVIMLAEKPLGDTVVVDSFRLVSSMIAQVGEGTSDPMEGPSMGNTPNKARITISFAEAPYRQGHRTSDIKREIEQALEGRFPADVKIVVAKDAAGPPQQPPINIELYGDDYDSLIVEAENMRTFLDLQNVPGVDELKLDVEIGKPELPIEVDREVARRLDVSTAQVAMTIRTALFGKDVSTYKIGDEDYDINVRYKEDYRHDLQALLDQKITFRDMLSGKLVQVPIRTVILPPKNKSSYSAVKHKNTDRVVTIFSNVKEGENPTEIVNQLKEKLTSYNVGNNVSWKFTGQQEDMEKEMKFLSGALMIAVFMVFLIIVAQFNSISSPAIIMTSVILSLIGVLLGLIIFQMDFVIIMTMIGIISLAGVVVNNAIVLIDYTILLINRRREELGIGEDENLPMDEIVDCIAKAGGTRLRPVMLTAITTLLGLIPLAVGINVNFITLYSEYDAQFFIGGDNVMFFGPLSWTVIFGLTFATFLTLVITPIVFLLIHRLKVRLYKRTKWKLLKTY